MAATRTKGKSTKRKPQARRKPTPPARGRRTLLASRPSLRNWLELEPHHVDVLALGVIAVGVLLAGVTYLHWGGGTLGGGGVRAIRFVIGRLGYVAPAVVILAGALILGRDWRPATRPLRTGSICLATALTLALAAGTFGIGPGASPARLLWHPAAFESRGGIVGQAELYVASHLFSHTGAEILSAFLLLAGVILLTGATLGSVVRGTRARASNATSALRRTREEPRSRRSVPRRSSRVPGVR